MADAEEDATAAIASKNKAIEESKAANLAVAAAEKDLKTAEEAKEKSDRDIVFQTQKKFDADNNTASTDITTGEVNTRANEIKEERIAKETEAAASRANIA